MAFIGFVYSPSEKYGDVNMGGLYFGRLWGLYSDANVGAVVCCVSIFLIAYLAISSKKLKVVLPLIAISIQLLFVSLSGSRSAIVALFVTTFVIVCLILFKFINFNNMKRAVTIIQKIVLSLFVSCVFVGAVLICEIAYEQIEPKILNMIKGPVSDPDALFPSYIADQVRDECGIPDPHEDEEIDDSISHVGILGRNEGGDLSNKRFSL